MTGLTTIQSRYSVRETIDRLVSLVESKGMTVFLRLDHSANARQAGLELRPTELIVFGNPKAGTVLMQDRQTAGIDLPVRALAWQDEAGKTWLSCNDADWLARRHELTTKSDAILKAIAEGMASLCAAAAGA
jgi:uncharacterized protein (DUF302 family)